MHQFGLMNAQIISKMNSIELVQNRKALIELNPWGWSPAEQNYLSSYFSQTSKIESVNQLIKTGLFERKHAVQLVQKLVSENPNPIFPPLAKLPVLVNSVQAIENYLNHHRQIVLKSPISSSGRGLQVIRISELNDSNRRWIRTNLEQQKYLVAEPLFNKKQDLSFQFEIKSSGEVDFLGISYFKTNSNGQYLGHQLHCATKEQTKYVQKDTLSRISLLLKDQLEESIFSKIYRGFLGIDALIFIEDNQIRIQPCLEINARYNMGILSKHIEKRIHPESSGMFRVYYHPSNSYKNFVEIETKKNPPVMEDHRLRKGFITITDPTEMSKFGAYLSLL